MNTEFRALVMESHRLFTDQLQRRKGGMTIIPHSKGEPVGDHLTQLRAFLKEFTQFLVEQGKKYAASTANRFDDLAAQLADAYNEKVVDWILDRFEQGEPLPPVVAIPFEAWKIAKFNEAALMGPKV